jgi:hypothetical protein
MSADESGPATAVVPAFDLDELINVKAKLESGRLGVDTLVLHDLNCHLGQE